MYVEKVSKRITGRATHGGVTGGGRGVAVKPEDQKYRVRLMLLYLLAGLDGATSHFKSPTTMATNSPPSLQATYGSKFHHIDWRAHGATPGLGC
ncbi:MAG: hypothetical protein ACKPKO_31200, partial [Candidatus Fonsibacter sp.]